MGNIFQKGYGHGAGGGPFTKGYAFPLIPASMITGIRTGIRRIATIITSVRKIVHTVINNRSM